MNDENVKQEISKLSSARNSLKELNSKIEQMYFDHKGDWSITSKLGYISTLFQDITEEMDALDLALSKDS